MSDDRDATGSFRQFRDVRLDEVNTPVMIIMILEDSDA